MHDEPMALEPAAVIDHALACAVADLTVIVERDERVDLRFAASTMTTSGTAVRTSVSVIAFHASSTGISVGTRSASVHSLDEVADLVRAAETAAKAADPADDQMPFVEPVVDQWPDAPSEISPDVLGATAAALGAMFNDRRDREYFGYAEHTASSIWLADRRGTRRYHRQRAGRLEINAKTDGRSRSAWVGRSTIDFSDVSVDAMVEELSRRLAWGERRVAIDAGRHPVILPPGGFADLMVPMHWASASRDAREERSAFSPTGPYGLGARIAPAGWSISSDPGHPLRPVMPFVATAASSAWSSVFDNGASVEPVDWLADGTVQHLAGPRAEQRHAPAARIGADNLIVTPGSAIGSIDDLIARTEHALLLTCLWYIREVDPQTLLSTGLTRDGVYVVRDGEVVGEAGNFRFNESPLAMLGRVRDAGAAQVAQPREWADYVDQVIAPPVLVDGFNLSTPSDAL